MALLILQRHVFRPFLLGHSEPLGCRLRVREARLGLEVGNRSQVAHCRLLDCEVALELLLGGLRRRGARFAGGQPAVIVEVIEVLENPPVEARIIRVCLPADSREGFKKPKRKAGWTELVTRTGQPQLRQCLTQLGVAGREGLEELVYLKDCVLVFL